MRNGFKLLIKDVKLLSKLNPPVTFCKDSLKIIINKKALESPKNRAMKTWKTFSEDAKILYKMRMEGEEDIKSYLRNIIDKSTYVPINEYAKFIKTQIETDGIKQYDHKFFYDTFQKWIKINESNKTS